MNGRKMLAIRAVIFKVHSAWFYLFCRTPYTELPEGALWLFEDICKIKLSCFFSMLYCSSRCFTQMLDALKIKKHFHLRNFQLLLSLTFQSIFRWIFLFSFICLTKRKEKKRKNSPPYYSKHNIFAVKTCWGQ